MLNSGHGKNSSPGFSIQPLIMSRLFVIVYNILCKQKNQGKLKKDIEKRDS